MGVVLGLLAAIGFGTGDFFGGRASTKAATNAVLVTSQLTAAAGALVLVVFVDGAVRATDLAWGAVAGVATAAGLGLLYHGLAAGRVAVVAPLASLMGSIVPVLWGLLTGERPGGLVLLGIGGAVVAATLIAREPAAADGGRPAGWSVAVGLAAGTFLGSSLVLFTQSAEDSGLWPVLSARVVAALVAGASLVVVGGGGGFRLPDRARPLAVGAGIFDVTGTALLVVGVRRSLASVIGPLASLAPGFTVLWAMVVLREPVGRAQAAGLALALVSLVLIAVG